MTKRFKKPGNNKHGITDKRLLNRIASANAGLMDKCETCGKIIYHSMMEAHAAAVDYNDRHEKVGDERKGAYECDESPGNFHIGGIVPKCKLKPKEPALEVFAPPVMPQAQEYVHTPVMHPVKIIEPAPCNNMDEITLNGVVYIKKSLVPPSPKIMGVLNMGGAVYNVIRK